MIRLFQIFSGPGRRACGGAFSWRHTGLGRSLACPGGLRRAAVRASKGGGRISVTPHRGGRARKPFPVHEPHWNPGVTNKRYEMVPTNRPFVRSPSRWGRSSNPGRWRNRPIRVPICVQGEFYVPFPPHSRRPSAGVGRQSGPHGARGGSWKPAISAPMPRWCWGRSTSF